jgi:hypothetical protein
LRSKLTPFPMQPSCGLVETAGLGPNLAATRLSWLDIAIVPLEVAAIANGYAALGKNVDCKRSPAGEMRMRSPSAALPEPFFLAFNARVSFQPVMTPEDLAKALPALERSVKAYGGGP